ncbi:MAG: helix-turn-helix domain-containing protein [Polyangiales bacterium]
MSQVRLPTRRAASTDAGHIGAGRTQLAWPERPEGGAVPPAATVDPVQALLRSAGEQLVGKISLTEAQQRLRAVMFELALRACAGNRSAAARVLGVDRRYVARAART